MDDVLHTYSITRGGPLRRAERAARIVHDDPRDLVRRVAAASAIGYAPVLALGIGWRVVSGTWPVALVELTTHVRVLVMLPLLLLGEQLIELRATAAGSYLLRSRLVVPEQAEAHRSIVERTERVRNAGVVEALLLVGAFVSVLALPPFTRESAAAIRWSVGPSVLLYRFLMLRILWRWLLWGLYLFRLSRFPLNLRATHPDQVGGLAPLAGPSIVFGVVVMAAASSAAASWGDHMRFEGVRAVVFADDVIAYIVLALAVAAAPLWVFIPRLGRLRKQGVGRYGAFATGYAEAFEQRWFDRNGGSGAEALGTADIQSLNDLGGSFDRVVHIRPVIAPRADLTPEN
ncbi:MAG TPA: hypothetical protein VF147_20095 [Vicinamibacterales bacterium]